MAALIGGKGCRNCAHHMAEGKSLFCRRYPPTAHPIVVMTPQGPQIPAWTAGFPIVSADMRCGEHSYVAVYDEVDATRGMSANGKAVAA